MPLGAIMSASMTTPLDFSGRWILVTGASSGLGEELCRQLGRDHRANLVLVARREERLRVLAQELQSAHGIQVRTVVEDLGEPDAPRRIFEAATRGREISAFISNAGMHWHGRIDEMPPELPERLTRVNALAPIALTQQLLPVLEKNAGGLLMITSLAGLMLTPYQAVYGGSKAMLQTFAENLYHELGGPKSRVAVSVCAPGGMPTEMYENSAMQKLLNRHILARKSVLSVQEVAKTALTGFRNREYLIVPGAWNKLNVALARALPRNVQGEGAAKFYEP